MIDLIKRFSISVIVVARAGLGTINHTLMTLKMLRLYNLDVLGVIVNGDSELKKSNCEAIEFYGQAKVLAQVPSLQNISIKNLLNIALPKDLKQIIDRNNGIK